MAFEATTETFKGIAQITLSGELDAAAVPQFRTQIERAVAYQARRLVLLMENLSYMSSAGIRELVFAKQKMGLEVDIVLVGVRDDVLETLRMTGVEASVILLDSYDSAVIERV